MDWKRFLMMLVASTALGFTGAGMTGCEVDVDEEPDGYEVDVDREGDWDNDREIDVDVDT